MAVDFGLQDVKTVESSADSACYFPLANGRYEVKPGLIPFGSSFNNGQAEHHVFQIDDNFSSYRQAKLQARAERLSKYYQTCNYNQAVAGAIANLILQRLTLEHPQYFSVEHLANGNRVLHNQLTQETLYLDANFQLQHIHPQPSPISPPYASTLDALAAQVQEDMAVVCRSPEGKNWLSAIHLCYPNHWAAEEKIGQDFASVHTPVAGMAAMNRRASAIVNTMIVRPPMIRFAWGLSTDTRLNHHPEPPPHVPVHLWQGRHFDGNQPRLYLRIERQVIWGLPEYDAALFTIRTYFRDCRVIRQDAVLCSQLRSAIESMTPDSLIYKGLVESKANILNWLDPV
jgi:hypothetical protein